MVWSNTTHLTVTSINVDQIGISLFPTVTLVVPFGDSGSMESPSVGVNNPYLTIHSDSDIHSIEIITSTHCLQGSTVWLPHSGRLTTIDN
jgi:hypothetical protein